MRVRVKVRVGVRLGVRVNELLLDQLKVVLDQLKGAHKVGRALPRGGRG